MRGERRMFPVGLYAMLLLALCCVVAPPLWAPVERWLRGLQTLPLRWAGRFGDAAQDPAAAAASIRLAAELARRETTAALQGGRRNRADLVPVLCRVLGTEGRGGADLPSRLLLDRSAAELQTAEYVTSGEVLLGFVVPPAADDQAGGPARVALLHERRERGRHHIPAEILGPEFALRCVVEPGFGSDRLPLRCRLPSEPYRLRELPWEPLPVRTTGYDGYAREQVPAGLLVGELQLEGYRERGLVVSLLVRPAIDPRAITVVTVWCRERDAATELTPWQGTREPVRLLPLAGDGSRALAIAAGDVPARAALCHGEWLLGLVDAGAPGQGVAVPPARAAWLRSFVWLPSAPHLRPVPLTGRLRAHGERSALLELDLACAAPPGPGHLFTGAVGPDCPAGLLLGRAELVDGWRLLVELPGRLPAWSIVELRRGTRGAP